MSKIPNLKEFYGRPAWWHLRKALRMCAMESDASYALRKLAEALDYERRRTGSRVSSVKLFAESFDYQNAIGAGFKAKLERDPNASAIVFVAESYFRMYSDVAAERDAANNILASIRRCRTIRGVKRRLKKADKAADAV